MGYYHGGLGGRISDEVFNYNQAVKSSGLPYHEGTGDWLVIEWPAGVTSTDVRSLEWYLKEHLQRSPTLNEVYRACELAVASGMHKLKLVDRRYGWFIREHF